ncbi:MAG: antibiotic biosynthesis monooxygenase [Bacteroidetes bacterium]|nr:antibiotic biosynthesis monooxygenase [Bacteroidota bacterium]MDA0875448.1 antibiotic biosynthesis monooxygenase [Bacteroidota bacterium]
MEFAPENVDAFLELFHSVSDAIRAVDGCHELTLLQDLDHPGRMTTYSLWEDEAALDSYRDSDLFRSTWARTKMMFIARPSEASYRIVAHLS